MKKILFFAWISMFALASQAQIVTSRSQSIEQTPEVKEPSQSWSCLFLEYSPVTFSYTGDLSSFDSWSLNALSVGSASHTSLADAIPLFFDYSFVAQFTFGEPKYSNADYFLISYRMPLGISYAFDIPNTPIQIIPNTGIDLRLNILAQAKTSAGTTNLMDKKDMGSSEAAWNIFQVGAHIGFDVRFWKKMIVGVQYQTDFMETAKDMKWSQVNLKLGVSF